MSSSTRFCRSVMAGSRRTAASTASPELTLLEQSGLHVELLGGDPQRLGELLQDLRAGLAQAALDLAQVGVGDAGLLGQTAQRELAHLRAAHGCSRRCLTAGEELDHARD